MLIVKLRCPRRESISCLEMEHEEIKDSVKDLILRSLSLGREACILTESSKMQRNSREIDGPRVFSFERGMPTSLKICLSVSKIVDQ